MIFSLLARRPVRSSAAGWASWPNRPANEDWLEELFEMSSPVHRKRHWYSPKSIAHSLAIRPRLYFSALAGIGALVSLPKTRFVRIDGVVRQGPDTRQCARTVRRAVCRAHPYRAKRGSEPHCNNRLSKPMIRLRPARRFIATSYKPPTCANVSVGRRRAGSMVEAVLEKSWGFP
jgi:hypothetical protein